MPAGQPTKFKEEFKQQAEKLAWLGATDAQIADFFGVTEQTLNNWKKAHAEFFESLKKGKLKADADIAKSLHHRAKGYSHPEDKIFLHEGKPVIVNTTKHYPPDTAAAFIWLKNRAGWKDKQDLNVDVNGEIAVKLTEARKRIRKEKKK